MDVALASWLMPEVMDAWEAIAAIVLSTPRCAWTTQFLLNRWVDADVAATVPMASTPFAVEGAVARARAFLDLRMLSEATVGALGDKRVLFIQPDVFLAAAYAIVTNITGVACVRAAVADPKRRFADAVDHVRCLACGHRDVAAAAAVVSLPVDTV